MKKIILFFVCIVFFINAGYSQVDTTRTDSCQSVMVLIPVSTTCDTLNMREHGDQYLLPYAVTNCTGLDIWRGWWSWGQGYILNSAAEICNYMDYGARHRTDVNPGLDFAQPYHTDTTINIIGIAAMVYPQPGGTTQKFFLQICDTTLDTVYRSIDITNDSCFMARFHATYAYNQPIPQYFEFFFDTSLYINNDFYVTYINDMNAGDSYHGWANYMMYIKGRKDYCQRPEDERVPMIKSYIDTVWMSVDSADYSETNGPFMYPDGQFVQHITDPIGCYLMFPILGEINYDSIYGGSDTTDTSYLSQVTLDKYTYIFPNPAENVLNVASSFGMQSLEIYNMTGEKVTEKKNINATGTEIDLSKLPAGEYITRIHTRYGTAEKKFVKK